MDYVTVFQIEEHAVREVLLQSFIVFGAIWAVIEGISNWRKIKKIKGENVILIVVGVLVAYFIGSGLWHFITTGETDNTEYVNALENGDYQIEEGYPTDIEKGSKYYTFVVNGKLFCEGVKLNKEEKVRVYYYDEGEETYTVLRVDVAKKNI